MTSEELLAEIEDVLRTLPTRSTIRDNTPESLSWLGRAMAVLTRWNKPAADNARDTMKILQGVYARESESGYGNLMILLNQARSDLRMATLGPVSTAIGHGLVFDYFDEVRKLIELAKTELFFVDPYLDAEFVSNYLPHAPNNVLIRLLTREKLSTLIPAVKLFNVQSKMHIELRSTPNFHDRYIIVDSTSCYQSGASFKDGARNAPTTITQVIDAFPAVLETYEKLWRGAKTEL